MRIADPNSAPDVGVLTPTTSVAVGHDPADQSGQGVRDDRGDVLRTG